MTLLDELKQAREARQRTLEGEQPSPPPMVAELPVRRTGRVLLKQAARALQKASAREKTLERKVQLLEEVIGDFCCCKCGQPIGALVRLDVTEKGLPVHKGCKDGVVSALRG